jgi:4-carboxymuconolactone decarboxylase
MKRSIAILSVLTFLATAGLSGCAADTQTSPGGAEIAPACDRPEWRSAVPLLGELTTSVVYGEIWERPQLSKRDRSMITVAALQASYFTNQLRGHIGRALDENGVTPEELSEIILHLTFYAGWPAAVNAGALAAEAFEERGIPLGQYP